MIPFKQFLNEKSMVLYRGYGKNQSPLGNAPFVWFSTSREHAQQFSNQSVGASKTRDGEVMEFEYRLKNPVDFRDADRRVTIKEFMSEAVKQTKVNPKTIKDQYLSIREKLISRYGNSPKFIHQFWYDDKLVAEFIDLLGFDAILAKEQNVQTVGILRRHIK